jgi:PIN domain nuclease of toxin-antitoxin system
VDLDKMLKHLRGNRAITIASLNLDVVLAMKTMPEITEMHDRLIVCETRLRNAKLITRDQEIQNANVVETVW